MRALASQGPGDLTVIEISRRGQISEVFCLGDPLFGPRSSNKVYQGVDIADLVDAELLEVIRQAVGRALRSRQLVRLKTEVGDRVDDCVILPQGRDRVLLYACDAARARKAMDEAHRISAIDPTTGLPNGIALVDQLVDLISAQRVREGRLALLSIHLGANDSQCYGLSTADERAVLCCMAERLIGMLRNANNVNPEELDRGSVIARSDYRQLSVLLPDIDAGQDAEAVADRLVKELSQSLALEHRTVHASPRIGVALFPQDGDDAESLMQSAAAAMEQAREAPQACYVMHSGTVSIRALERQDLASELLNALRNERFELRYQPIVDATHHGIVGIEALLRWPDTLLANQPAQRVVSLAERTGVIIEIGDWVIASAFEQLQRWREQYAADFRLAINLSAPEFASTKLIGNIESHAERFHLDLTQIEFDLREHLVARDLRLGGQCLSRLAGTGARIVLEGFGSGQCPMQDIAASPISAIKVAQPLTRDGGIAGIRACRAAIAAARTLVDTVCASGIETYEQAECMTELGCTSLQGYYFGRPVSADDIDDLLGTQTQRRAQ